jgi:hypothetical protein
MANPDCSEDSLLRLNYARTLQAVGRNNDNDMLLCQAAEVYISVQAAAETPDAVKDLAGDGATELLEHCAGLSVRKRQLAYTQALNEAKTAIHDRAFVLAALLYNAAVRINRERIEAHRSLCKLLKRTGDKFGGAAHCEAWRSLIAETQTVEMVSAPSTRLPWLFTGLSAAALLGGFASYVLASSASDDAFSANARARATMDVAEYTSADNDQKRAVEKLEDLQVTSWVLFGLGAGLAGVGTYYWFSGAETYVSVGPSGLEFHTSF